MYCNFLNDYKKENTITANDIACAGLVYGVVSVGAFLIFIMVEFIRNTTLPSFTTIFFNSLLTGFIVILLLILAELPAEYFSSKKNTYSLFKFRAFKKWYVLSPEKFVFDSATPCVYYIHTGDSVAKDKLRDSRWDYLLDITTMYPESLVDCICYKFFIHKIYRGLEKNDKLVAKKKGEVQKQKDIIYANNEMMRVMGSIQGDIDKILSDTQQIIVNETAKMEKLNKSI